MPNHYIILGAGITGLTLAWYLQKQPNVKITLIEKSMRPGGWIATLHGEDQGFLFDQGPRSCRTRGNGLATLQLIEELGLNEEVIFAADAAKKRYLYKAGKLSPLPSTALGALFTSGLAQAIWRDLTTKRGPISDESIATFIERRLGRAFANCYFDPLVSGIYAGDMEKLSITACFPFLKKWEAEQGGILKGIMRSMLRKNLESQEHSPFVKKALKNSLFSFKGGMETLPYTLAKSFKGELLLGETVESYKNNTLYLKSGRALAADRIYSTIPAYNLLKLLPLKPLNQIPYVSIATVHLGYHQRLPLPSGFGYLIPSSEKESILGVVYDSSVFPQQNRSSEETRLTVMLGSGRLPNFNSLTKEQLLVTAQSAISRHLKIAQRPDFVAIKIAAQAIPQYLVGHMDRVEQLENILKDQFPQVTILGSAFYGVSVNDCIAQSKNIASSTCNF